jgi:prefoldin subunit 5
MTEQQTHLSQLVGQQNQLINEINNLTNQLNTKRELVLKVQGAIEYLEQIGVTLPAVESDEEDDEDEDEDE